MASQVGAPYPLFVQLEGARVVVVGAGRVAARKVETLLEHGADVTVVSPDAVEEISGWADEGLLRLERRPYARGDLSGALLVVAATSERAVNEAVFAEAQERAMLVNIVDVPDLCNCIVPSVMRRGRLQVAVSTGGAAPSVAREVRRSLEERFPDWWEPYLDLMADVRALVKERVPGPASARTPLFEAVGGPELRGRVAAGERPSAEDVYTAVVAPLVENVGQRATSPLSGDGGEAR